MKKNSLQYDFENRKLNLTNRSSAIFPILFKSKENDLIISWLNYWSIKNKIETQKLRVNFRIYRDDGRIQFRGSLKMESDHHAYSVRDIIGSENFEGMIEIEIISTENLFFPFPAISGVFRSGDKYSSVHSAGRLKSPDEAYDCNIIEETNWNCKFEDGISPFFHFINGPEAKAHRIKVNLYHQDGTLNKSKIIDRYFSSFSSKIFFIDEIFSGSDFLEGMFVGVECVNDSVFRRMIVGNFHREINFLEVTHTFPRQKNEDYCPKNPDGCESFLAVLNDEEFDLRCRIFPTNCDGADLSVTQSIQNFDDTKVGDISVSDYLQEGFGNFTAPENSRMLLLELHGDRVPSRLNSSFIYRVKAAQSNFSTDIATGAKSNVYPEKFNHWGGGVFGDGYDFCLLIRNISHQRSAIDATAKMIIFGMPQRIEYEFMVSGQSARSIKLSDLLKEKNVKIDAGKAMLFSWYLQMDQPTVETFWLSHRRNDGAILGCHGF